MNSQNVLPIRRMLTTLVLLLASFATLSAHSQTHANRGYVDIQPRATANESRVEVLEFFWYACPHCNRLNPHLSKWKADLPKEVEFRRVPALLDESWVPMGKLYYALETMGQLPRLHDAVFAAIHMDHTNLADKNRLETWIAKHGLNHEHFFKVYNSFGTQMKVNAARQLAQEYRISGVPTLIVDGRFASSPSAAGGNDALIGVLDHLVGRSIKEKKLAAK
jgi:thiol:disulfide interchange protein DsbA